MPIKDLSQFVIGNDILKITGQTEETYRLGSTVTKYDPIYVKFNGTKLANPATLPAGAGRGASFDPTGTYLAIAHDVSPYVTIYKRSGDTFTKLADPATLPASTGFSASFDPTGTYLAIAHDVSPYVTIYKRSGDTFTKLADPATLPASTGFSASFDPTGTYLAIAHDVSPYVTIYTALSMYSSSSLSDLSISAKAGYAKETGIVGDMKKAVIIFR
ncbi:MAG: hypothetical protein A4E53_02666 [Pelotomaculum sp. PtaB.Bin104]|nr:MAG: hypothetical protein A4E53_02666 [Pelotomaculum sp. PtaB.Bin104]